MSRISPTLAVLAQQGRKALIPYITAGDPFPDTTVDILLALAVGGADIIELGVPFSDPMADGPVIQKASERALAQGMTLKRVLHMVREFRQRDTHTPIVLMGYANPFEHYGMAAFVQDAKAAGVDGVLVVDYPPEESQEFARLMARAEMDPIFLLAPTSTEKRMQELGRIASGYVYYVALKGVTGAAHLDTQSVAEAVPRIKQYIHVPVGVGFGIRDAATAKAVASVADAVVIGSSLVQLLEQQQRARVAAVAREFVSDIRKALDSL